MAVQDPVVRARLADAFARQDFYEACKRRDLGALITILREHGVTQGHIFAATGIPQGRLSQYKTGKHQGAHVSTFEKFADGLEMPDRLRRALLGDNASSTTPTSAAEVVPTDTFDLQLLAAAIGRNGSTVKRRDMFTMAAQLGAAAALAQSAIWERLTEALAHPTSAVNESVVREMESRSAGFHRLEEIVPAPTLLKGLTVQLKEVTSLLNSAPNDPRDELRRRLIVVAGETGVLAGWLASDAGDSVAARSFYDMAMKAADEAGDPAIAACALAYRSYIPSTKGSNARARVFLSQALDIIPSQVSPATLAWLESRHAEESAILGDKAQALRSLGRAAEAYSVADPEDDRVWTRFLDRNRFDSYRIATFARTGKLDEAQETAATVLQSLEQPDRKKAAIILEDIASAHLARGAANDAATAGKNGLIVLRETGFGMWLPRFEALAKNLSRWQRQTPVRAYLEEFALTKRQFTSQTPRG